MRTDGTKFPQGEYLFVGTPVDDGHPIKLLHLACKGTAEIPFHHGILVLMVKGLYFPLLHLALLGPVVEPMLQLRNSVIFRSPAFAVLYIFIKQPG